MTIPSHTEHGCWGGRIRWSKDSLSPTYCLESLGSRHSQQAAQYDQLGKYVDKYAPYAKGGNFSVELVNNGTNPQGEYASGEANMDVQITVSMAFRVPVRFYATRGEEHGFMPDLDIPDPKYQCLEPWLQFARHLLDLPDGHLPQVMSISYGGNEQTVPKPYALRICQIFGLVTLRDMSIILASGDQGPGVSCQSNDGTKTTKFLPAFPAGCPYVTVVGATEGNAPERGINFSSGGFSEYWPRPWWQEAAVSRYLDVHGDKWKGYYNQAGRGFPDVSAQGTGYPFFNHNKTARGGGTRVRRGIFIPANPPTASKANLDEKLTPGGCSITHGRSEGCKGRSFSGAEAPVIPGAGWDAVEGWHPATGLGTPLFDELQKLAMESGTA
ncbi:tripeptidyl-peptidase 1 precursor [Metarhizium album ARSEF 1941]|uniref:Tripeptidyl-peptidase 1 n=1 Tax=Metarhizium album (strain ARSEF 1941) TaxID=1081103 RepID=A0A0B2WKF0_METAS|nr:tripeptidyl-peptidase 1 precursor [Metarhizium album ARSEF 1941]KHN96536.1 tripeptidyl-peptidase 1 precursor [Metarhizium album ARSEF 1941]